MAVLPPDPVFNLRNVEMGQVNCVCFHDSERLLCGSAKGMVYLWDLQVMPSNLIMHFQFLYYILYNTDESHAATL